MHFEILIEDQSGKKFLDILMPKIVGENHTFAIHPYKGIGSIPKDIHKKPDPKTYALLNKLPLLLAAYGKTFANYPEDYPAAVIVVCDLDNKSLKTFKQELLDVLESCNPKPKARFCIAIEEGEAWLLGDIPAIKSAYPKAKDAVLNAYKNDSICGTWERLADAVFAGGSVKLSKGRHSIGKEKSAWAKKITPHMDVKNNKSPSFCYFKTTILNLTKAGE